MKNKFFILFLILTSLSILHAQNIDSLKNILETGDSQQIINSYLALSEIYFYTKPDTSEYYLKKALKQTEKSNDLKKQAQINIKIGILHNERGNINNAKSYFLKALKLAKTLNDTSLLLSSKGNIGNCHLNLNEYNKAITIYTEVIELAEKNKNIIVSAIAYGALGNLYLIKNDYDKALYYYQISEEKFKKLHNSNGIALSLMNIATVYSNTEKYKEAIPNYIEANKLFILNNNLLNSAKCISGIAKIYSKLNNYSKAVFYEKKALETYKKTDAKMDISYAYSMIGQNYMNLKKYHTALIFLDSALKTNINERNYGKLEQVTNKIINCYDSLGDYRKAYEYSKLHKSFYDSVFNIESESRFSELEIKFETKKREQELELVKKNQELFQKESRNRLILLISISSFIILVLIILVLVYNRKKLKTEIKQSELENKLLRVQMNPHFIFNALSSIENFMYKNDLKSSSIYIAEFSKLMRLILESSGKELIPLNQEIKILNYYTDFQKLRVNYPLNFTIQISDNIDIENCLIPPMIIQPFIENSIKHGFNEKIQEPTINLTFELKNNFIFVEIKDNGVGFNHSEQKDKKHHSLAVKITKERILKMANKKNDKDVLLNIQDLNDIDSELHGTKITFKIPYIEEF